MPVTSPPILDADAIARLFKEEAKTLCGWLWRKVKSQSIAEEIVQDTFVKALRHASGFRGDSTPKTWLYAIALNTMRNRFNTSVSEEEFDSIEEVGMPDLETEDVLDVIDRNRRLEAIGEAWKRLPEEYQSVLQMIVVDGVDYETVAQELGIPQGTVKSRVHRARTMLKEESQKVDVVSIKGIEMFQEKRLEILRFIADCPGIRRVQVADLADVEPDMVEHYIRKEIEEKTVQVVEITAPNGHPTNSYSLVPELVAQYRSPEKPPEPDKPVVVPSFLKKDHEGKKKTKVELALDCIRERGGRAADDAVRTAMGITGSAHLSAWLAPALSSKRIRRDGRDWILGEAEAPAAPGVKPVATPTPAPAPAPAPSSKPDPLPELPAFLEVVESTANIEEHPVAEEETESPVETQTEFHCALWSDGELTMIRDGETLAVLNVEETKILCKYLDRILTEEAA